ncbi:MAG: oxygen-independent coproporphyrinogen III oxidase [candidate division Zixibacteria bacterium]|nr:oxygen-independent coproporphyrinogen III oxidase [candidate division Zixibacteria bacterium]
MSSSSPSVQATIELLRKYDRPGPRYTSYPTVPVWSQTQGPNEYREALIKASHLTDQPLALYCHIPFCRRRCLYCGCTTFIASNHGVIDTYIDLLHVEIDRVAGLLGERNSVNQLHFGGGTPTMAGPDGLAALVDHFKKAFRLTLDSEMSIELDPRTITRQMLADLKKLGFNRLSMGIQDLDPAVQEAVGRIQPFEMIAEALRDSREIGFTGINFDLIYGLPKQTIEGFGSTVDRIIGLRPDRIAFYSFAYLPQAMLHQQKIVASDLPSVDVKYRLFATSLDQLIAAGYQQIGMDHVALPSDELALALKDGRLHRNFMGYTVKTAPDMIGIGMSSIGFVSGGFYQNHSKLESYREAILSCRAATYRGIQLTDDDRIRQYVITTLMCNFTLSFSDLTARFGVDYHQYFTDEQNSLGEFVADRLLTIHPDRLEIPPMGRTFVRNIAMTFDAYLNGERRETTATFSRTI